MAGIDPDSIMQRRPLHMVALHDAPHELNGHCLQPMSDKPFLTVTTAHGPVRVWWLGGNLAEEGVARSEVDQGEATRQLLSRCLPWLQLAAKRLSMHRIARAEGLMADRRRPDGPVAIRRGRVVFGWPTKLALAPMLAEEIAMAVDFVTARGPVSGTIDIEVATPPWEAAP
jgi:hypothetical protein